MTANRYQGGMAQYLSRGFPPICGVDVTSRSCTRRATVDPTRYYVPISQLLAYECTNVLLLEHTELYFFLVGLPYSSCPFNFCKANRERKIALQYIMSLSRNSFRNRKSYQSFICNIFSNLLLPSDGFAAAT